MKPDVNVQPSFRRFQPANAWLPARLASDAPVGVVVVFIATSLFALAQNHLGWVGGPISTAKTLWLSFALQIFLVIPFYLWLDTRLPAPVRQLFGVVFLGFAIRGVVELFILYFTRHWECIYGISHDLLIFAIVAAMTPRAMRASRNDSRSLWFVPLLEVTLLVECFMAWQFSKLASPQEGIYFAADSQHFQNVNRWSWLAVIVGYPALAAFLWRMRRTA